MRTALCIFQIILCVVMTASVILQPRKQSRFSGIFGGGTQADVSSARQWSRFTLLSKITVVCCVIFMITSVALVLMH